MLDTNRKTLAVIGAGPKGLAIAVKAKVLEEFGFLVDKVILIEKQSVAAHWSGEFGYTNGELKLGTSPEKDVVFPLEIEVGDAKLNTSIQKRLLQFTWTAFLVQTKRYSDWIDRGRPLPCHQLWALYLQWIAEQLAPEINIISAEVVQIDVTNNSEQWKLTLQKTTHENNSYLVADKLMLTGPGKTKMDFIKNQDKLPPSTYDLESFWSALKSKTFSKQKNVAVIGAGENAAGTLLGLAKYAPDLCVDIISPKGFISTRGENFYENQVYTHPEKINWKQLSISERIQFIERTDRGVFSIHAMNVLNDHNRHQIIAGRVVNLEYKNDALEVQLEYQHHFFTRVYSQVILATGFDQYSTLKSMLTKRAMEALKKCIGFELNQQEIALHIDEDLSVRGMQPPLYLPMLAGIMQGPGFANLSCLGLLSDRVITNNAREQTKYLMNFTNNNLLQAYL